MTTPLILDGEWTIARASELKTALSQPGFPFNVDLAAVERVDLAVLQCLLVAHGCGHVERICDPQNQLRREAERHGLWHQFSPFTSL